MRAARACADVLLTPKDKQTPTTTQIPTRNPHPNSQHYTTQRDTTQHITSNHTATQHNPAHHTTPQLRTSQLRPPPGRALANVAMAVIVINSCHFQRIRFRSPLPSPAFAGVDAMGNPDKVKCVECHRGPRNCSCEAFSLPNEITCRCGREVSSESPCHVLDERARWWCGKCVVGAPRPPNWPRPSIRLEGLD